MSELGHASLYRRCNLAASHSRPITKSHLAARTEARVPRVYSSNAAGALPSTWRRLVPTRSLGCTSSNSRLVLSLSRSAFKRWPDEAGAEQSQEEGGGVEDMGELKRDYSSKNYWDEGRLEERNAHRLEP